METRRRARWLILATFGGFLLFAAAILLEAWISSGRIIARARERTAADLERLRTEIVHRPPLFEPAEEGNAWDVLQPATAVCTRPWWDGYREAFKVDDDGRFTRPWGDRDWFIDSMELSLEGLKRGLSRPLVETDEWSRESRSKLHGGHGNESRMLEFLRDALRHRIEQGRFVEATHLAVLALGLADRMKVKSGPWCEIDAHIGDRTGFEAVRDMVAQGALSSGLLNLLTRILDSLETHPGVSFADVDRRDNVDSRDFLLQILDDRPGLRDEMTIESWSPGLRHGYSWRVRIAWALSVVDSEEARVEHLAAKVPVEWFAGFTRASWHGMENIPDGRHRGIMRVLQRRMMLTMARVSLATARHAADSGRWPPSLDSLVPKYLPSMPVDPWAHRPLRLALKGEEAEISTVEMSEEFLKSVSHSQFNAAEWRVWTVKNPR